MSEPRTSTSTNLTVDNQKQYDVMGFLVFRKLFSSSEMVDIEAAFTRVMEKAAAETGHDNTRSLHVYPITEGDDRFDQLIDDNRINDIVEGLFGEDCIYHSSGGHLYIGNSGWHSDAGVPGHPGAHMAFYLDPVRAGSGCLSVIPGSHHREFHEALVRARGSGIYDFSSPDIPGSFPLESDPGDVVLFRHELLHSSWGGHAGRRMFGLHFEASPTHNWQRYHLMGVNEAHLPYCKAGLRLYSDRLVDTAGPRRMKRLRKFIDMGYHDESRPPLTNLYYAYSGNKYGESANEGRLSGVKVAP